MCRGGAAKIAHGKHPDRACPCGIRMCLHRPQTGLSKLIFSRGQISPSASQSSGSKRTLVRLGGLPTLRGTQTFRCTRRLRTIERSNLQGRRIVGSRFNHDDPRGPPGSGSLSDMAIFGAFDGLFMLARQRHRPGSKLA
jgi:hypothetical protein